MVRLRQSNYCAVDILIFLNKGLEKFPITPANAHRYSLHYKTCFGLRRNNMETVLYFIKFMYLYYYGMSHLSIFIRFRSLCPWYEFLFISVFKWLISSSNKNVHIDFFMFQTPHLKETAYTILYHRATKWFLACSKDLPRPISSLVNFIFFPAH